jgi:hypothetical protein
VIRLGHCQLTIAHQGMSLEDDQKKKLEAKADESRTDSASGDEALDLARDQLLPAKDVVDLDKSDKPFSGQNDELNHHVQGQANRLDAARLGQSVHSDYFSALRESKEMGGNWYLWKIDETVGDKKRPDVVYRNDIDIPKRVIVEDLYTGSKADVQTSSGPESKRHNDKGWNYSKEPMIQDLIADGYSFEYLNAPWNPRRGLDELN